LSENVNPRFLLCSSQSVEFARKRAEANPGAPTVEVALETAEKTMEYKPLEVVDRIAPRALLLIVKTPFQSGHNSGSTVPPEPVRSCEYLSTSPESMSRAASTSPNFTLGSSAASSQ
jgi:hypothetical protein